MRKLRSAVIDNAIYYGSFCIIFVCILVYLLVKRTVPLSSVSLKVLLITTSNTWGLFLTIIFLGYGLVEVPRSAWRAGNPTTRLRLAYFQLSKRYLEYVEDEEDLKHLLQTVREMDAAVSVDHPLRPNLNLIIKKAAEPILPSTSTGEDDTHRSSTAPTSEYKRALGRRDPDDQNKDLDRTSRISPKALTTLNKRLKMAQHQYQRAQALYVCAVRSAAWLEDVEANWKSGPCQFQRGPVPVSLQGETVSCFCSPHNSLALRRLEWYWKCCLRRILLRLLGLVLAVMSALFVWSECTFFVRRPVLSVVAVVFQRQSEYANFDAIALFSFAALGYLSFCVYFTVYRLRLFNFYRLVPNHHTDARTLIFYGALLCRLTPSLCLNFLCLAQLDSHLLPRAAQASVGVTASDSPATNLSLQSAAEMQLRALPSNASFSAFSHPHLFETAYTKFMGHLDVVAFIADGFNIYFPILVVVFCLCTYFRLASRLLHCLGIPQLLDSDLTEKKSHPPGAASDGDCIAEQTIADGKLILDRERALRNLHRYRKRPCRPVADQPECLTRNWSQGRANPAYEHDDGASEGFEAPVEFSEDRLASLLSLGIRTPSRRSAAQDPPRPLELMGLSGLKLAKHLKSDAQLFEDRLTTYLVNQPHKIIGEVRRHISFLPLSRLPSYLRDTS
ncbi:hypothetical protein AAHC03_026049 [Spirometra sp. Aus1]